MSNAHALIVSVVKVEIQLVQVVSLVWRVKQSLQLIRLPYKSRVWYFSAKQNEGLFLVYVMNLHLIKAWA